MAITLDATSSKEQDALNTATWSHTCTGSNLVLGVVTANYDSGGDTDGVVTGVTYNGVALTKASDAVYAGLGMTVSAWYLIAPATGANNIVVTCSGTTDNIKCAAASYTGASQTSQPNANVSSTTTSGKVRNNTFTTTQPDCRRLDIFQSFDATWASVGAGQTTIFTSGGGYVKATYSGPIAAVGSDTDSATSNAAVNDRMIGAGLAFSSQITRTNLTKGGSTTDATSIATASVTFTANRLYILTVNSRTGISTNPNQPTATGGNVTWTVPTNGSEVIDTTSSSRRRLTTLYGICSSTTTGAVTIDFGGQSQETFGWIIDEMSGVDTTTPIVQAAKNNSQTAVTSITATLAAFGSSNNATYGAFGCSNGTNNPTAGTGFTTVTENTDAGGDGNLGLETEFRVDNDTTVDFTFSSDSELGCIGLEIKASVTGTVIKDFIMSGFIPFPR